MFFKYSFTVNSAILLSVHPSSAIGASNGQPIVFIFAFGINNSILFCHPLLLIVPFVAITPICGSLSLYLCSKYSTVEFIIPIIGIEYIFFTSSNAWLVAVPHAITINFTFCPIKNSIPCFVNSIILSLDLLPYGNLFVSPK